MYETGEYFGDPRRHAEDAAFKAAKFLSVLERALPACGAPIGSYVDVGTGSGDAARIVVKGLRELGAPLQWARGYDVSPHVAQLEARDGLQFVNGDFSRSDDRADLVTLFDVIEHIPAPVEFVKAVAQRARLIGLHIPLDDSWNAAARNLFRSKMQNPGHLVFFDIAGALNVVALAGLRVVDYEYTFGFAAPSGRASRLAKIAAPLRSALARLNPWLMSKTLGGASVMVVALTPAGVHAIAEGHATP